jgi:hypothetical protein
VYSVSEVSDYEFALFALQQLGLDVAVDDLLLLQVNQRICGPTKQPTASAISTPTAAS